MTGPALLIEPNDGAHQGEFLLWIARAWAARAGRRPLVVAAPPGVLDREPRLEAVARASGGAVRTVPYPPYRPGGAVSEVLGLDRWDPLEAIVRRERPSDLVFMSFEHIAGALAARRPLPAPTRLHALTLRPTLHYPALGSPPRDLRERARMLVKRAGTAAALRHPALDTVLTLDPTAADPLARLGPVRTVAVPDPVPEGAPDAGRDAVRAAYAVPPGRHLVVLPGRIDGRKGAPVLMEALARLPPAVADRLAVVVAGRVVLADRPAFDAAVGRARRRAWVTVRDERLADAALAALVAAADLVVLPYDRHVGSSGFLMRAAGAGVPVLTQAYGLMGHLVRTEGLGSTTRVTPADLALALSDMTATGRAGFDRERALRFARARSTDAFAAPFLDVLHAD